MYSFFILIGNILFVQSAFADDEVVFECANLKNALTQIIGEETITVENIKELEGKLDLSYQNITSLVGLEYAVNVQDLILSFNNITDIAPIASLENLQSLYLDYNWIRSLPNEKTNLISLKHLDISNNEITEIPGDFIDMPALKRLYMGDLSLSASPDLSPLSDTLERLDISRAKYPDFSFVEKLTALELLMMNDCQMRELPNLSQISNLNYLYFSDNNISSLPEYLGNFPLIRLDFSGNLISYMPQSFANLTKLEQLVMTNNYFTYLPNEVTQMKKLEVLMCGQNIIADVSDNLSDLENIKRASFASNNLTSLNKFINFEIPYSYQISFDLNYLDLADETNFEVLNDYHNVGGVQRQAQLEAQLLKTNTNSIDIKCALSESEVWMVGEDIKPYSIMLFSIQNKELDLVGETQLYDVEDTEFIVSYENAPTGISDYIVCLVFIDESWPTKYIKYSTTLLGVQIVEVASPTLTSEVLEPTATMQPTTTQEIQETKGISTKYLLYILLVGVIIIISAIIIHMLFYRRK